MLATLIASVVSGEASEAVGRMRAMLIAYLAAAVLCLAGVGFLVGAAFLALAREIGSMEAALWFGGGFIALALVVLLIHRIMARTKARRVARRRQTETKAVASAAALALLPTLLAGKGRPLLLLGPVLGAIGYAIYRENNPRRRHPDGDGR